MKQIYIIALSFVLVIIGSSAFAQKQFWPTQVIKLNGDTLKGVILYNNWDKSPDRISFSEKSSGESSQIYSAADIIGFSILFPGKREAYQSITSVLDTSAKDLKELKANQEPEFSKENTFFALIINEGALTLLEHKDHNGKIHYFIQEKNNPATELIYKAYLDPENSSRILYNKKYLLQLAQAFKAWPSYTPAKLRTIQYDDRSISKVIMEYNIWKDGKTEKNQTSYKKETLKVKPALVIGMSNTSLKTSAKEELYPSSSNVSGGISFGINIPRTKEKWAFNNELLYQSYKVDGTFKTSSDPDNYKIYNHIYSLKYIRINTMAHFIIWKGVISPFIDAGISNSFAIHKSYDNGYFIKTISTETTRESTPFKIRGYEQGIISGLGAKFNKISIETRYEFSNGFSDKSIYKTSVKSIYGLISYSF